MVSQHIGTKSNTREYVPDVSAGLPLGCPLWMVQGTVNNARDGVGATFSWATSTSMSVFGAVWGFPMQLLRTVNGTNEEGESRTKWTPYRETPRYDAPTMCCPGGTLSPTMLVKHTIGHDRYNRRSLDQAKSVFSQVLEGS